MKDGIKTTEMWMAVVRQVLLVLVAFGALQAGQVDTFMVGLDDLVKAIIEFGAVVTPLVLMVIDGWNYLKSRTELKKAALVK